MAYNVHNMPRSHFLRFSLLHTNYTPNHAPLSHISYFLFLTSIFLTPRAPLNFHSSFSPTPLSFPYIFPTFHPGLPPIPYPYVSYPPHDGIFASANLSRSYLFPL